MGSALNLRQTIRGDSVPRWVVLRGQEDVLFVSDVVCRGRRGFGPLQCLVVMEVVAVH